MRSSVVFLAFAWAGSYVYAFESPSESSADAPDRSDWHAVTGVARSPGNRPQSSVPQVGTFPPSIWPEATSANKQVQVGTCHYYLDSQDGPPVGQSKTPRVARYDPIERKRRIQRPAISQPGPYPHDLQGVTQPARRLELKFNLLDDEYLKVILDSKMISLCEELKATARLETLMNLSGNQGAYQGHLNHFQRRLMPPYPKLWVDVRAITRDVQRTIINRIRSCRKKFLFPGRLYLTYLDYASANLVTEVLFDFETDTCAKLPSVISNNFRPLGTYIVLDPMGLDIVADAHVRFKLDTFNEQYEQEILNWRDGVEKVYHFSQTGFPPPSGGKVSASSSTFVNTVDSV